MKRTFKTPSKGVEQARQQLPAILDEAAAGRATVITRRGEEVAAVVPIATARLPRPMPLTGLAGTGRGLWGDHSARTISRLRDEWSR
jgi:prevent-host-death family protein